MVSILGQPSTKGMINHMKFFSVHVVCIIAVLLAPGTSYLEVNYCNYCKVRMKDQQGLFLDSDSLFANGCCATDTVAAHRNGTLVPMLKDAGAIMVVEA